MKELFRESDYTRVGYYQTILEGEGIQTFVRNQHTSNLMTSIPIPEFYPALCVVNEEDYERALEVLRINVAKDQESSQTEVPCPKCQETNPGNFETCWSCGSDLVVAG